MFHAFCVGLEQLREQLALQQVFVRHSHHKLLLSQDARDTEQHLVGIVEAVKGAAHSPRWWPRTGCFADLATGEVGLMVEGKWTPRDPAGDTAGP